MKQGWKLPALLLLLVGGLAVAGALLVASTPGPQPNIVMIIACTLRKDQVTAYGGHAETSPFIAEMAGQGTKFTSAYTTAPWTKPASTAIMTGQFAISVGMIEPDLPGNRRVLSSSVTTLAEFLKDAGYYTIGLTVNPNTNALFNFDQGFDEYYEREQIAPEVAKKVPGGKVVQHALAAVKAAKRGDKPLYLRLMMLDAHEPIRIKPRDTVRFQEPGLPQQVADYRAAVRKLDNSLRGLWEGLDQMGFTQDNTVFVLVNDHGEGLNYPRHHGPGHGNFTYRSTIDMVWTLTGPGIARGHTVTGLASQVDVLPTLISFVGQSGYEGPGRDWSDQIRGRSAHTDREFAFVDTWFNKTSRAAVYTDGRSCHEEFSQRRSRLKKAKKVAKVTCYDDDRDHGQENPFPEPDQDLVARLGSWRDARWAEYQAWPDITDIELDDELIEELEALGYVGE